MRVGILGGSFNPPHLGHLHISNLAIKKLSLNQVWWIPTERNPLKNPKIYASYENRLRECQKLTSSKSRIHIKKFNDIYTYRLLRRLNSRYKTTEFFWIMGADNLEKFHQWENFSEITKKVSLAIFSRETFLGKIKKTKSWKTVSASKYQIFRTKNMNISSTQIREKNAKLHN